MKLSSNQILELLNEQLVIARSTPSMEVQARTIDDLITKIYEREELLDLLCNSSSLD